MKSRTLGTLMVLIGSVGVATELHAQGPSVALVRVGPPAHAAGPCRTGRVRPVRRRCAVPRRTAVLVPHGYRYDRAWTAVGWGSAYGPTWIRRGRVTLRPGHLREALGQRDHRRIRRHARALGLRGPLTGVWTVPRRGPVVLEVRSGGAPVAALLDHDRDGWTEVTLLRTYW